VERSPVNNNPVHTSRVEILVVGKCSKVTKGYGRRAMYYAGQTKNNLINTLMLAGGVEAEAN
jgi:hypothetical protein